MSKFVKVLIAAGMLAASGCSYPGFTMAPDGKVIVPRNDGLLYGALRKVYVCNYADGQLSECAETMAP